MPKMSTKRGVARLAGPAASPPTKPRSVSIADITITVPSGNGEAVFDGAMIARTLRYLVTRRPAVATFFDAGSVASRVRGLAELAFALRNASELGGLWEAGALVEIFQEFAEALEDIAARLEWAAPTDPTDGVTLGSAS